MVYKAFICFYGTSGFLTALLFSFSGPLSGGA